jgi:predicted nucleic acid-binding protein
MSALPLTCVLDASVGIKLFVSEDHSEDVQGLLDLSLADPDSSLLVPDLFFVECANVLRKKVRLKELPEDLARDSLSDLAKMRLVSTVTRELVNRAWQISCRYSITAYDACYVALAEARDLPLLTADNRLVQTLSNSPIHLILLGA